MKNDLQIVSSLLNLQLRVVDDPYLRALVQDCRQRIQAMALIHEALYQADDLSRVPLKVREAFGGTAPPRLRGGTTAYSVTMDADHLMVDIDKAAPCALIFHDSCLTPSNMASPLEEQARSTWGCTVPHTAHHVGAR